MNPIFIFFVILGAVVLWLLFAFAYKTIGGIVLNFIREASNAIKGKDIDKLSDDDE